MINLSAIFSAPVGVITNQISYARIDNTTTPVFIQAGNFVTSPAVIASNIPDGQYEVNIIPIYPDGRVCAATTYQTPACPSLNSISAYISSGNLIVQYNAPSTVPKVRITVGYPNGGSNVANYVNTGNPIVIALPVGLTGDFTVQGQSVCDEGSAFYSAFSSIATVSIGTPVAGTYTLGLTSTPAICSGTPGTFYTNGAFAIGDILYTDIGLSIPATGFNFVVFNNSVYAIDPSSAIIGAATGSTCSASITGITGLSPGTPVSSGTIMGVPGTTIHVVLTAGGTSGGTYTVNFNISSIGFFDSVTNGSNGNTFVMPSTGSVNWSAAFVTSNSSGSGTIGVY